MSTTATLVYTIHPVPPVTTARLQAAVSAVNLNAPETQIQTKTGCTFISDTTVPAGTAVTRTIVFGLPAAFQANFPVVANQASAFRGLVKHVLAAALGSVVEEAPVVIA